MKDKTIQNLFDTLIYGIEEKKVLEAYIELGYGEEKASWLFGQIPMKPKKVKKYLYKCKNCGKEVVTKKLLKRSMNLCSKGCMTYAEFEALGMVEVVE